MGIYLSLLPLRKKEDLKESCVLCYERIEFDQDYVIFGQLHDFSEWITKEGMDSKIPQKPHIIPKPIPLNLWLNLYDDDGLEKTREDRYGDELTFVFAKQLKHLKIRGTSAKNKAIKAFIKLLPNDTPIILFWH